MPYIGSSEADIKAILKRIGISDIEQLFDSIPENMRLKRPLALDPPLSEFELQKRFSAYAGSNTCCTEPVSFLGAGLYQHFVPALVDHLILRSEFYSAYTPYQPEISQGTLQTIFEYQTYVSQLTGMEVANATLYDGSTAMAEGVLMACRIRRGGKILVSQAVHPEYREVLNTYSKYLEQEIITLPYDGKGCTDREKLEESIRDDTVCLVVQSPNFFGCMEKLDALKEILNGKKILLVVVVNEMISLGFYQPPGVFGADIAVGEAQSLGIPVNYGGPLLGFLATRDLYKRNIPGRLAGQTVDSRGQKGFVLTLNTREQHIRRERATSNICTNQALCGLAACIYLSVLGQKGFAEIASQNYHKAAYARKKITGIEGYTLAFNASVFNEFVVKVPHDPQNIAAHLKERGILAGLQLGRFYPELDQHILFCVTEIISKDQIDLLVRALEEIG